MPAPRPPLDLDFPHAPELEALWRWTQRQPWSEPELRRAMATFIGASRPTLNTAAQGQQDLRFVDWYHLERPLDSLGGTPLTLWLAGADSPLAHTVVGAFRVRRTVAYAQAVLEGLRDGETYHVRDKALSVGVQRGQLVFGRLYPHDGHWVPGASLLAVDADVALALAPQSELEAIADGLTLERAVFQRER